MHAVYNFRVSIELKSLQIPYKGGRTTQRMRGQAAWMNRWEKRKKTAKRHRVADTGCTSFLRMYEATFL